MDGINLGLAYPRPCTVYYISVSVDWVSPGRRLTQLPLCTVLVSAGVFRHSFTVELLAMCQVAKSQHNRSQVKFSSHRKGLAS